MPRQVNGQQTMKTFNSRSVSENLESYASVRLAESSFFSALAAGEVHPDHIRMVFSQYYLWHSRLHRWFGVCVAKSPPFDEALNVPRVLDGLIAFLRHEISRDHHRSALAFLGALGISDPSRIKALPVTNSYAESFLHCYSADNHSGDEALAALSGQALIGPSRNRIIAGALPKYYGVTSGLEFFGLDRDRETRYFRALWQAMVRDQKGDTGRLIEAATLEIWEHITFWDDVYYAILGEGSELAS
jgi:hypothetical protein